MSYNIFIVDAFNFLPANSNNWVILGPSLIVFHLTILKYIYIFLVMSDFVLEIVSDSLVIISQVYTYVKTHQIVHFNQ